MPSTNSPATGPERGTDVLGERPLIVASNRGPVTFTPSATAHFPLAREAAAWSPRSARSPVTGSRSGSPAAMTDGDRLRAEKARRTGEVLISPPGQKSDFRVQFVVPEPERPITSTTT